MTIADLLMSPIPILMTTDEEEEAKHIAALKRANDEHRKMLAGLKEKDMDALARLVTSHWREDVVDTRKAGNIL